MVIIDADDVSQFDLDKALDVLEFYKQQLEDNEPYATNQINALEQVIMGFPHNPDELKYE